MNTCPGPAQRPGEGHGRATSHLGHYYLLGRHSCPLPRPSHSLLTAGYGRSSAALTITVSWSIYRTLELYQYLELCRILWLNFFFIYIFHFN